MTSSASARNIVEARHVVVVDIIFVFHLNFFVQHVTQQRAVAGALEQAARLQRHEG